MDGRTVRIRASFGRHALSSKRSDITGVFDLVDNTTLPDLFLLMYLDMITAAGITQLMSQLLWREQFNDLIL